MLVPQVLSEISPEAKNHKLTHGIYSFFAMRYGTKHQSKRQKRQEKHVQALNSAKNCKNNARKELRQAKINGTMSPEEIMSLARKFFQLVRTHNRCKRATQRIAHFKKAKAARHECHDNFWPFAKQLLDDSPRSDIEPQFSEKEATQFFTVAYGAESKPFVSPSWMSPPAAPTSEFNCEDISMEEISVAVKKSKAKSVPCPLDGVPYIVFKKCPALLVALHDLFNTCWVQSIVPSQWKTASVKLIAKQAAKQDPTLPSNFRPIALTPCVGKLFTTILRNRWLSFMLTNNYLDRSIQKAFMPRSPGCIEHHQKLATILRDAKQKHKALAVCWLDLANAYGSVHHSLIHFTLQHYHAPPQFLEIIQSFYSNLSAKVNSNSWSTPLIPLKIGVYQGDPLSVVIFNTVINTMVEVIKTRPDLGYHITNRHSVNLLQYADDMCLIANSPSSCQQLLHLVDRWLSWSGMKAKVAKCHSLAIKASVSKLVDPHLSIDGQHIPFALGPVKFLGRSFQIPHNANKVKQDLSSCLQRMLERVDSCPLTRRQKLKMYRAGVCPRLSWPLMIEELPITWVEKKLDAIATFYVKRWAGLARSANTAILYLPSKMGGLNLPIISVLYKRLQVTRQAQLLSSSDSCVRHLAERALQNDLSLKRPKFRPSVVVRDVMVINPDYTRRSLYNASKVIVEDDAITERLDQLISLEKEGHMFRIMSSDAAKVWGNALIHLPEEHMRFALNSAVDTLPHNANLHLWRKRGDDKCSLCGQRQTLILVLNVCPVAMTARRFNHRHDAVLERIAHTIESVLQPGESMTSDLSEYTFPHHIVPTTLRPDIVWWSDIKKRLLLIELTVCFETSFDDAAERKTTKYEDLKYSAQRAGYHTTIITLEVGSRGIANLPGFHTLKNEIKVRERDLKDMLQSITMESITQSHKKGYGVRGTTTPHSEKPDYSHIITIRTSTVCLYM